MRVLSPIIHGFPRTVGRTRSGLQTRVVFDSWLDLIPRIDRLGGKNGFTPKTGQNDILRGYKIALIHLKIA